MSNPPPTRKASVYSSEELAQLNRYRDEYMTYKSSMKRTDFLKKKLGPKFFNWCTTRGKSIGEPGSAEFKTAVKQLSNWVYNTWRLPKKESRCRGTVRVIDVVRATMAEEMDAEVKKILKKDVERGSPEYFQQQNKALSNIVQNLPAAEYARLQAMAKEWNEKGSPPEEQRRTTEKHGWKRVQRNDVHRRRDMGMVCLTFMAYHASDGDLLVLCQDNIAQNMGAVATPFRIEYEALCTEMKKKLVNYVTMLERSLQPGNVKYVEEPERDPRPDLQVILDEEGFPQLPEPPSFPQKHEELVRIVRKFLNAYYRLASRYTERAAPYGALKGDNRKFVDAEYIPSGLTLQEPGNLKMDELKKLLNFWREREAMYGVRNTFRFAKWIRGKEGMVAAIYSNLPRDAAPPRTRRKRKSKKSTKHKGETAELELQGDETFDSRSNASFTPAPAPAPTPTPEQPPMLSDPPIDPILLKIGAFITPQPVYQTVGDEQVVDPSAEQVIAERNVSDTPTQSTFMEDATPAAAAINGEPTERIGFEVMQRLRERGYPDVPSDNGPVEGHPEYIVPLSALRLLDVTPPSPHVGSAPKPVPRKRKRKKQANDASGKRSSRNSNALMYQEAQGILTGPSALANSAAGTQICSATATRRRSATSNSVGKRATRRR
ncbi:hypothetical protein LshimejAT787_2700110 [Lyophyllum shimeji]|uniref:Uncharacterized protein n=1 Tax=Lyophyllum shimeji TaxID=47721 RepID=A0A9P3Q1Q0_LYOSH|nr:hypothetical protein LshimejAT787_2700110 [Lyophyllum shimeji]